MYSLNVLYVHHPQQRPIIDSKLLMAFFPYQLTYAVVEFDMEKTLQALNDPIANVAAANIKTAKCIVYLDVVRALDRRGSFRVSTS